MITKTVDRLVAASERPDLAYKVTILNSGAVNAFALPTGQLYVTRGLIALASDTSELSSVLAHEMAHVLAKHAAIREDQARQAALVARWLLVGFIHGVMNTDNMTLSGETIDYGPCAFLEAHDPAAVFSSIDTGGRYRFGAQPGIAQWNLARYAETLLPLLAPDPSADHELIEAATERIRAFGPAFDRAHLRQWRTRLGLDLVEGRGVEEDRVLVEDLLALLRSERLDHTRTVRLLGRVARGETSVVTELVEDPARWSQWQDAWLSALAPALSDGSAAARMDQVNPLHIPRNHLVEEALAAALTGDLAPVEELVRVVSDPFVERPGQERYAAPAPADFTAGYVTYCGT